MVRSLVQTAYSCETSIVHLLCPSIMSNLAENLINLLYFLNNLNTLNSDEGFPPSDS